MAARTAPRPHLAHPQITVPKETFRICVQEHITSPWAYVLSPDLPEQVEITKLTLQVLHAMMTSRAQVALLTIAQQWCLQFMPHLTMDSTVCVLSFLSILEAALRDNSKWPPLVLRYGLHDVSASFIASDEARRAKKFRAQDFIITLNGNVSANTCLVSPDEVRMR